MTLVTESNTLERLRELQRSSWAHKSEHQEP